MEANGWLRERDKGRREMSEGGEWIEAGYELGPRSIAVVVVVGYDRGVKGGKMNRRNDHYCLVE